MVGKKQLTTFQLVFLLIHSQIGVGVITLPFDVFTKAKGDAWISVLITGLIIQIIIFMFAALMNRFPSSNLYDIAQFLFGKVIGKGIIILYSMYFIFVGSMVLAKFSCFLKAWMMPLTPKWLLFALMCFTAIYIVKENLQILARFVVLSSVVFIGFIGAAAYALKHANITFILPIGTEGVMPVIQGLPPSLFAFQGFELLLIIYPFVQSNNRNILKAATIANIFVTFFYAFLVLVSLLFFSPKELKLVPEPILYLVKAFSFRIIERPDLLFTSMWIVLVATTFMCTLYASSLGLSKVMDSNKLTKYAVIVAAVCFVLGLTFHDVFDLDTVSKMLNYIVVPVFWVIPILFLVISILFNKREEVKSR